MNNTDNKNQKAPVYMLGEFLVQQGVVNTRQLMDALEFQKDTMKMLNIVSIMERSLEKKELEQLIHNQLENRQSLETAALELNYISQEDLDRARSTNKIFRLPLGEVLVQQGALTKETLEYWLSQFKNFKPGSDRLVKLLQQVPLFKSIKEKQLTELGQYFKYKYYPAGEIIFDEGEENNGIYVIESGLVRMSIRTSDEMRELGIFQSGDYFGIEGILEHSSRPERTESIMNTVAWRLEPDAYERLITRYPRVAMETAQRLSSHIQDVVRSIKSEQPVFQTNIYSIIIDSKSQAARKMADAIIKEIYQTLEANTQLLYSVDGFDYPEKINADHFKVQSHVERGKQMYSLHAPGIVETRDMERLLKWLHRESKNIDHLIFLVDYREKEFIELLLHNSRKSVHILSNDSADYLKSCQSYRDRIYVIDNKRNSGILEGLTNIFPDTLTTIMPQMIHDRNREKLPTRIIRWFQGQTVTLAFGGGGARGLAHIGILEVLAENNIEIDEIAGTSVGAIVGACMAYGMTVAEIKDLFIQKVMKAKKHPFLDYKIPIGSIAGGKRLQKMLVDTFGDIWINETALPFNAVTTDMQQGKEYLPRNCRLVDAVKASATLPGILPLVKIHNRFLGDGGIVNNIPASILKKNGAGIVISLNITADPARNEFKPGSLLNIFSQTMDIVADRAVEKHYQFSDIDIRPKVDGFSTVDFKAGYKLMDLGRAAAEPRMSELKRLLFKFKQAN